MTWQHTAVGIELGAVEVVDDALDLVDRAVPAMLVSFCISSVHHFSKLLMLISPTS